MYKCEHKSSFQSDYYVYIFIQIDFELCYMFLKWKRLVIHSLSLQQHWIFVFVFFSSSGSSKKKHKKKQFMRHF